MKNITLSIVVLVPLVGIGGVVGSSMTNQTPRLEANPAVTIQPLEMHRATDMSKLPNQEISSLF
jgi:hypothetical protein